MVYLVSRDHSVQEPHGSPEEAIARAKQLKNEPIYWGAPSRDGHQHGSVNGTIVFTIHPQSCVDEAMKNPSQISAYAN